MIRLACLLLVLLAAPARAAPGFDPFAAVDLLDRSGNQLPLDADFTDTTGASVTLADLLHDRPAILVPAYYRCSNVCSVTLANLMTALSSVPLVPGTDFTVIAYSIDPSEGPADARAAGDEALRRHHDNTSADGFRFLTGERQSIARLSAALGFRYAWDAATQQYAHAAAIATLTPDGRVGRWLYGIGYQPEDLRLALIDAGDGRIGGLAGKLLLLCHRYDPQAGTYRSLVQPILMSGAGLTLAVLVGFVGTALWRERARGRR